MIDDFITSFLLVLGEENKIHDLSISGKIISDLVNSNEDFNHICLKFETQEWVLPLPNSLKRPAVIKYINVETYC